MDRSPAATRETPPVRRAIGRVRRRSAQEPEDERGEGPDPARQEEGVPELVKTVEVDLDRIGHVEESLRTALGVEDRREARDPQPALVAVDARVPGHAVPQRPAHGLDQLGRERVRIARLSGPAAGDDQLGDLGIGPDARDDRDRAREKRLVLDRGHRPAGQPVPGGVRRLAHVGPHVQARVEGGHPGDVQELRPDGVLDLSLLARVGHDSHGAHGQERQGCEEGGQPDAEPLPGPERRGGRRPGLRVQASRHARLGPCAGHRCPRMRRSRAAVYRPVRILAEARGSPFEPRD